MKHVVSIPAVVLGLGFLWGGCSDPDSPSNSDVFDRKVVPVLEERCAAAVCHGLEQGALRDPGVELPDGSLYFRTDAEGHLVDADAAEREARRKINTVEPPIFSSLLRKPLSPDRGGLPHEGGVNFPSPQDPDFEALRTWIHRQDSGGEDPEPRALSELENYFANEVQPRLIGRNCAAANCHGLQAFNDFRLDPGIPTDDSSPKFSVSMTRANYDRARGFLAVDAHADQSRLLRKGLPLEEGGMTHRGGNRNFFENLGDPAASAITKWSAEERVEATRRETVRMKPTGIVFVRGPVEPSPPLQSVSFVPGRDLHLLRPARPDGEVTNLTASLHDRPVDIRDPAVSFDGRNVAFAMRRSEQRGFQIWELNLRTGKARRLTVGPQRLDSGRPAVHLSPVYGPGKFMYLVSNRHDVRAERGESMDLDLYRMPKEGGELERLTYTPAPELEPELFGVAPFDEYLVFSYRRSVDHRDQTIGFSLPIDFHTDYHIYFGRTAPADLLYQFSQLPDGRSAVIAAEPENVWGGGALALVDRGLGPDLSPRTSESRAAVPSYAPAYRPLDAAVSPTGTSRGGMYREPVALPDGSLLVAHAPSSVDLRRRSATPDYRIERLEIEETPDECSSDRCLPSVGEREVWVDADGVSEFDPEPVRARLAPATDEAVLNPTARSEPARYSMAAPGVNNAIMSHLAPSGSRKFRDDIEYVRFIEALPRRPDRWGPVDAGSSLSAASTDSTAGAHMPSRILGEVPVANDGSLYVRVPPNTPFRTQFLDENRMVVGRQHNRWLYVWPGQHFSQSTRPGLYDQRCGGCHGSSTGRAVDAWQVPDATSSASLTLARYENRNPRRPRPPRRLGAKTRRTITFNADVQPILNASCNDAGCHDSETAAGGLNLSDAPTRHYSVAYEELLAEGEGSGQGMKYVDQAGGRARTSYLVEVLEERELDAPRTLGSHPSIELSNEEILTVVRWIETGAHFELK